MVDIGPQLWHPEYVGKCGRSSVVERYLAKVDVVSSSLIARLIKHRASLQGYPSPVKAV
jgi:hypothetical protein